MPFTLPNLRAAISQYDGYKRNSSGAESATIGRLRNLARQLGGEQGGLTLVPLVSPVVDGGDITEQVLGCIYPLVIGLEARKKQFVKDYDRSGGTLNPVRRGTKVNLVLGDLYMHVQALLMPAQLASTARPQRARPAHDATKRSGATARTSLLPGHGSGGHGSTGLAEDDGGTDMSARDQVALVGAVCCIWCCGSKAMKEQLGEALEAEAQKEAAKATTGGMQEVLGRLGL